MSARVIKAVAGIAFVAAFLSFSTAQSAEKQVTTNFILQDLSGKERALKDFRDKIVVLIFGELYHQNTLKAIQDLKKILSGKQAYRDSVEVVIVISEGGSSSEYLKIQRGLDIPYPILLDNQRKVYAQFEIIALPTTFIIDRKGVIAAAFPSYTIAFYDQISAELAYVLGDISKDELEKVLHPTVQPSAVSEKKERYLSLAESLRKRGSYDNAMDAYQEVLKDDPGSQEAHLGLGTIYIKKMEADKAEEAFQFVLGKNPDDPAARKGMAEVYLLKGNVDGAEDLLQKLTASGYVDEDIFFVMGELYEKKGNFKEAMYYYKKHGQRSMPEVR